MSQPADEELEFVWQGIAAQVDQDLAEAYALASGARVVADRRRCSRCLVWVWPGACCCWGCHASLAGDVA